MFTWGSKFFFGISFGSLLAAVVYGLVTGGGLGVISLGYKGGVGDHVGYGVLVFAAVAAFIMGLVLVIVRDGDAEIMAQRAGVDAVPAVRPPADVSYWGPIAGFGVGALIVGLALSPVFYILGIGILGVVAMMWLLLAWSDRATGDAEVNRVVRDRVGGPLEIPMLGMLGIAVVAVGASRVFLAASATGAVVFGSIFTVFVFGAAVLMSKVDLSRSIVSGIVALGALLVLGGGIVGAALGERELHHGEEHSEDHSEDHSESETEG